MNLIVANSSGEAHYLAEKRGWSAAEHRFVHEEHHLSGSGSRDTLYIVFYGSRPPKISGSIYRAIIRHASRGYPTVIISHPRDLLHQMLSKQTPYSLRLEQVSEMLSDSNVTMEW